MANNVAVDDGATPESRGGGGEERRGEKVVINVGARKQWCGGMSYGY